MRHRTTARRALVNRRWNLCRRFPFSGKGMGRHLSDLEFEANDVACSVAEHVNQLQIDESVDPSLNGAGRHLALPLSAPLTSLDGGAERDALLVLRT